MTQASEARVEPKQLPLWRRTLIALGTEVIGIHPRLHVYNVLSSFLPQRTNGHARANLLRRAGFAVGAGTRVLGPLHVTGPRGLQSRLRIGIDCTIEPECTLDLSALLSIGDRVTLEPGVMILTSTHELDFPKHRAGKVIVSPVTIGAGAWLRARCTVLPGVQIGAGAVVEVGAVVNKNVEPNTRVGGIPAVKLEVIQTDGS